MLFLKALLIILNTLCSIGALIALILYVRKTAEIATMSEQSTEYLSQTSTINRKGVEISRNVLSEMKETRKLLTAPFVIAYFERKEVNKNSYLYFTVENIGNGLAKNISYTFSPELTAIDNEEARRIIRLGKHIDSLPSNYQMRNLLGRAGNYINLESIDSEEINTELPKNFELDIIFHDAITNERFQDKILLDMRIPLGNCKQ